MLPDYCQKSKLQWVQNILLYECNMIYLNVPLLLDILLGFHLFLFVNKAASWS